MEKIKIAFIGCGGIGNYHFGHLLNFDDVELVGFCDLIPQRAEDFQKRAGSGRAYTDFKIMLANESIDVCYICVPPCAHGEIEELVIGTYGLHVMIEKPVCLDPIMADKISAMINEKNLVSSAGFQDRYLDIIDETKKFLEGRRIGLISGAWVGGVPNVWWWMKRSTCGGQIVEQNIHLFDMLRYLIGEPESVFTAAGRGLVDTNLYDGYDTEDYSSTMVTFKNGIIANLFTGCYHVNGGTIQNGLTFYATDATIEYKLRHSAKLSTACGTREVFNQKEQGTILDRTFIDAVRAKDPTMMRSPYEDAVKSLKFTLACNESMDTGRCVKINY